jgi:signal transduction histidine kinase
MERRQRTDGQEGETKRQTFLKKKDLFLFFFVPLLGIIVIFFILSTINRSYIKNKVEGLVKEQLQATAEILKVNISHFLSEDYPSEEIFSFYSGEENIYFMALLDEKKEILGWHSRFEGYLPLSQKNLGEQESWTIDSPAGKIFNIFTSFIASDSKTYHIYLGYSLENLEEMILHSRRNFFILFGIIAGIGIIFFLGIYQIQKHYLEKVKETETERREKERYKEISAFTSGVAHEIKNPLNSLALLFELLAKKMPEEFRPDIATGSGEVHKISRVIDHFSASLKPLELKKEKLSLKGLMADIQGSIIKEDIDIQYEEEGDIVLHADKGLLSHALLNLLQNSLEATDKGGIRIQAKKHKKKILVTVKDSGKGMSEAEMKKIFDPFFSKKKDGMGIGLYLTKKIIEAHEGKLECESQLGKGTSFFIQIPGG